MNLEAVRARLRPGGLGRETVWALAVEMLGLLTSVLAFGIIAKGIGPVAYGGYVAVFGVIAVLGPPIAGGLALSVLHHGVREQEDKTVMVRSVLTLALGLGVVLATICFVVATRLVPKGLSKPTILAIVIGEMVLVPLMLVISALVQAYGPFASAMQMRMAPNMMRFVGLLALVAFRGVTITNVGIVLVYSYIAAAVPMLIHGSRLLGVPLRPGRPHLRHARSGMNYGVGMSALGLQNDGDKIALSRYGWLTQGGQYGAAYKIVQIGFAPVNGLLAASHNRFLAHDPGARDQHLRRSIRFAAYAFGYGAVVSALLFVFAPIVPWIVGEKYRPSVTMMRYLSPVVLFRSLGMFPLNGLLGLGRTAVRTGLLIFGAVVSVASYVLLVPRHSWRGAVAGTLISESLLAASAWTALVVLQARHNAAVDVVDPIVASERTLLDAGLG